MSEKEVFNKVKAGEMTLEEFSAWVSDRHDEAWGDGVDAADERNSI
jgi:hypothetical protein